MRVKKHNGKVYGAALSESEKNAMVLEIKRQIAEADRQHVTDVDAMVLYSLYNQLGFGKKRLRKFYDAFTKEHDKLIKHYEMPDDEPWLCKQMLKRIGVDIDEWEAERIPDNEP